VNINDSLSTVNSVLKTMTGLGMSLAITFLVVDLLFPGTTNIVNDTAEPVNSFVSHGLVGFITLIVFVDLFKRE